MLKLLCLQPMLTATNIYIYFFSFMVTCSSRVIISLIRMKIRFQLNMPAGE